MLHFDGIAYSSRFKNFLLCGSPVIMGEQTWDEWFYPAVDNTTYIPVNRNCSDTADILNGSSLEDLFKVGQRGQALALHLFDEDSVDEYFYYMIKAVADLGYASIEQPTGRLLEDVLLYPMQTFLSCPAQEDILVRLGLSAKSVWEND